MVSAVTLRFQNGPSNFKYMPLGITPLNM